MVRPQPRQRVQVWPGPEVAGPPDGHAERGFGGCCSVSRTACEGGCEGVGSGLVDARGVLVEEGGAFIVDDGVDCGDTGEEAAGLEVGVVGEAGLVVGFCLEGECAAVVQGGVVVIVDFDDGFGVDLLHAGELLVWGCCVAAAHARRYVGEVGAGGVEVTVGRNARLGYEAFD